jgi:hypothetical protein
MTKRAFQKYERKDQDFYPTPREAVLPVVPYLRRDGIQTFADPCVGDRSMADVLEAEGFACTAWGDLSYGNGLDARRWESDYFDGCDAVITNPPWDRASMPAIMTHLSTFRPCWFLIYWDWLSNRAAAPFVDQLVTDIVPIGRVKWIPDSASVGFDNSCWVRMASDKEARTPAHLWPRA